MRIQQGLHAYRLALEQNNPREVAFVAQWEFENSFNNRPLVHTLIPDCTDRDEAVAATIIQWLGSNVGMSFIDETMKRSPEVKRWLQYRLGVVEGRE